ncbi:hypothetical protein FRC11_005202 [Ceratobasidium sp. 423]|nr:hypothetical protein FRC11_005202 [Ceratobasidium sp. 423]
MKYCIDLASIVEYLHGKGIVHGDIKADNILLSDSGDIQLIDFGSATLNNYLTLRFTHTSSRPTYSLHWTAPEILDETSKSHTTESDVYALGMTILEILTGRLPYEGKHAGAILKNVLFLKSPPDRPTFDGVLQSQYAKDTLWSLLLGCWEYDPNLRPTAMEVKQSLIETERVLGA